MTLLDMLAIVTITVAPDLVWETIDPVDCVDAITLFEAELGEGVADYRCNIRALRSGAYVRKGDHNDF